MPISFARPLPFAFGFAAEWQTRRAPLGMNQSDEVETEELKRLSETSPHLLRDIGFRQETDGTWTDGRWRVDPSGCVRNGRSLGAMRS